jgi:hypothetical protein
MAGFGRQKDGACELRQHARAVRTPGVQPLLKNANQLDRSILVEVAATSKAKRTYQYDKER